MVDLSKVRIDYLKNHKELKVCQHQDMYHFNTDTCLLGEFIKIKENEKVLDVGTNNGALLVYIISKGGKATGIEIVSEAIEISKLTLKENNFEANLINMDFLDYIDNEGYDVIVSNPPYFVSEEKEKNESKIISVARHEGSLTLKSLIKQISLNLKKDGRVYLVHRPNRFNEIKEELKKNNMFINNYAFAIEPKDNKIKSLLIEASFKEKNENRLDDIVI